MTYRIEVSEAAEAEIDAAYLWISRRSPEWAGRWHIGLLRAIGTLADMPGRCPLARESPDFSEEVRQLLYGRGRTVYRIVFVIRSDADGEEGSVRIIHVRHAAQAAPSEGGDSGEVT